MFGSALLANLELNAELRCIHIRFSFEDLNLKKPDFIPVLKATRLQHIKVRYHPLSSFLRGSNVIIFVRTVQDPKCFRPFGSEEISALSGGQSSVKIVRGVRKEERGSSRSQGILRFKAGSELLGFDMRAEERETCPEERRRKQSVGLVEEVLTRGRGCSSSRSLSEAISEAGRTVTPSCKVPVDQAPS
ncbi:hypothetical protein B0H19DRAFT_1062973 [Mycena capillaripes]|nr:hypothetical protein B0H19DRAFT_1062973 [Mycena capillaripes]